MSSLSPSPLFYSGPSSSGSSGTVSRHLSPLPLGINENTTPHNNSGPGVIPPFLQIYPSDSVSNISARPPSSGIGNIPQALQTWTSDTQLRFENQISRITASALFPFTWVENPEIISLFDTFLPQAVLPSRYKLSRRSIPRLATEYREQGMKDASGGYATIQGDGWTGRNDHHLIALMIRVDGKVYLVY